MMSSTVLNSMCRRGVLLYCMSMMSMMTSNAIPTWSSEECTFTQIGNMATLLGNENYQPCVNEANGLTFLNLFGSSEAEAVQNVAQMCVYPSCKVFLSVVMNTVDDCMVTTGLPYPINAKKFMSEQEETCQAATQEEESSLENGNEKKEKKVEEDKDGNTKGNDDSASSTLAASIMLVVVAFITRSFFMIN